MKKIKACDAQMSSDPISRHVFFSSVKLLWLMGNYFVRRVERGSEL